MGFFQSTDGRAPPAQKEMPPGRVAWAASLLVISPLSGARGKPTLSRTRELVDFRFNFPQ
jgi:hypothetical protein